MVIKNTVLRGLTWSGGNHPHLRPIKACLLGAVGLEITQLQTSHLQGAGGKTYSVVVLWRWREVMSVKWLDDTAHGAQSLPPRPASRPLKVCTERFYLIQSQVASSLAYVLWLGCQWMTDSYSGRSQQGDNWLGSPQVQALLEAKGFPCGVSVSHWGTLNTLYGLAKAFHTSDGHPEDV